MDNQNHSTSLLPSTTGALVAGAPTSQVVTPVDACHPAAHSPANEPEFFAAAALVAAEIDAVADEDVQRVNVDVMKAFTIMLAAWNTLVTFFEAMGHLPDFDMNAVRKLRAYGVALTTAHTRYMRAVSPPATIAPMIERALGIRERTLEAATHLARFGLVDATALTKFGGTAAHRKVAQDLIGLAELMHERWPAIQGKTPITLAEMDDAARLAMEILEAVAERDGHAAKVAEATMHRDKAFTLFVRTYDQARRAMIYLRWNAGDADELLPSLYAGRSAQKRDVEEPVGSQPAADPASAVSAANGDAVLAPSASPRPKSGLIGSPDSDPRLPG